MEKLKFYKEEFPHHRDNSAQNPGKHGAELRGVAQNTTELTPRVGVLIVRGEGGAGLILLILLIL